jgi:hypothetical protein
MYAAYEALPDETKDELKDKKLFIVGNYQEKILDAR